MYKETLNRLTPLQKRIAKPKDEINKIAKKQELINADPTKGVGDRVPAHKIFEGLTKQKSKNSRN
jgi:hypothetical protein